MSKRQEIRTVFENERAAWRFSYYAPGERMASHRHDCAQFSLVMTGAQRESSKGHSFDSVGMSMALKPANFVHENEFGENGVLLLSINLYYCGEDDREIRIDRWRVRKADGAREEWMALATAMSTPAPDGAAFDDITDDLLAAMIHCEGANYVRRSPPPWLERARAAVVETDMSVDEIARDAGVHRVHFSRSFRTHYGLSVSEQRRRARLARAATAIIHGRVAPAAASAATGFSDQSHLTREMRRETGVTPGALARLFPV